MAEARTQSSTNARSLPHDFSLPHKETLPSCYLSHCGSYIDKKFKVINKTDSCFRKSRKSGNKSPNTYNEAKSVFERVKI